MLPQTSPISHHAKFHKPLKQTTCNYRKLISLKHVIVFLQKLSFCVKCKQFPMRRCQETSKIH